ncbi:type II toxin-antitoxin system RelE/ParE family toxin [Fusibacter sp. 3D3]|uniref:type II toxin-antitoxin system RelE/ParE family toxin n=1 Tax=Fusibacter sp. 3D3 TaxID=1048380 RepID=UPI0008536A6B|nr:type II toxin-antitoxin system RelE/ParE family toxin [Fusibacter sp. 3D3]GAU79806.1 hypothetical protein F3D3_4471 [Fusibacter sp. 3D3]
MYKLTITELAQNDLDEIVKYILLECANKMAAVSFLDEVDKCYALLQNSPRIYSICLNKRLEKEGYRRTTQSASILECFAFTHIKQKSNIGIKTKKLFLKFAPAHT